MTSSPIVPPATSDEGGGPLRKRTSRLSLHSGLHYLRLPYLSLANTFNFEADF